MEQQKVRANNARYRESGHGRESPSEYFIRKLELLQMNFNYNNRELINQIMGGFPSHWIPILTPHLYYHVEQLQAAIKFHEELLLRTDYGRISDQYSSSNQRFNQPWNLFNQYRKANVNLAGSDSKNPFHSFPKPQFPKDDSNVSRRATPESKNMRPCRHCGSGKHWDPECKYSRRGERQARVNLVEVSDEDLQAQVEYDDVYYGLDSDDERGERGEDFQ
jgi:hypothetical protein